MCEGVVRNCEANPSRDQVEGGYGSGSKCAIEVEVCEDGEVCGDVKIRKGGRWKIRKCGSVEDVKVEDGRWKMEGSVEGVGVFKS